MTRLRTVLLALALVGAVLAGLLAVGSPTRAQDEEEDRGVLAGLISNLLTTPTQRISIGAVEGVLSSRATIQGITIADEDGVWLSVDTIEIDWSRTALLLQRRLEVTQLTLGTVTLARLPEREPAPPGRVEEGPIFPELPLEVRIDAFGLGRLVVGEPVLGEAAELSAEGLARIGDPEAGLVLDFRAERLDAPGSFVADVAYRPIPNELSLDIAFEEPAGGLVARLLDLPGLPPVTLTLQGEGPLTAFAAELAFEAGPTIGAEGLATVNRTADAYVVDVDVGARLAGLLPPAIEPVFEGVTQLRGLVTVGDDGRIGLERVALATPVAALTVSGAVGPQGVIDVTVAGRALPTENGATRAGAARIEDLALDLAVAGTLTAPRISGSIEAAGVDVPGLAVESVDLTIASEPIGTEEPPERFSFDLDATALGIVLEDAALGAAIGPRVVVRASGEVGLDGLAEIAEALIETDTASARFAGEVGPQTLMGDLVAAIPDLAPFSGLAGTPLTGAAELDARLSGDPSVGIVSAALDARLAGFTSGIEALDGLLGETATLQGSVQRLPDGFQLTGLRLDGANLAILADGRATQEDADVTFEARVDELARLDARVTSGFALVQGRLTGTLAQPNLAATASIRDATAMGSPVARLDLRIEASDLTGALDARVALSGLVAGESAEGRARVRRPLPEPGLLVEGLALTVGTVDLSGDLAIGDSGLVAGEIALAAVDLSDVAPLLLTDLAGSLRAQIALSVVDGGQNAAISASGNALVFGEAALSDFAAELTVADLYRAPVIDGEVQAVALAVAGQTFQAIRVAFDGTPAASAFDATATAEGFDLAARGRIEPVDEAIRVALDAFSATRAGRTLALRAPAAITIADGTVAIDGLVLDANGGSLSVTGTIGETLALDAQVSAFPLSIAEVFVPDLGLAGTLDGTVALTGTAAAPQGTFQAQVTGFSLPATREAGLPPLQASAQGTFDGTAAQIAADIAIGPGTLAVSGRVPFDEAGALALEVQASAFPLSLLDAVAPDLGLEGTASATATIGGTRLAPTGTYTADATGVSVAQTRALGLPAATIGASGTIAGGRIGIDATVAVGAVGTLGVAGSAPLGDGPLDITVTGPVALTPLAPLLDPGQRVEGQAQIALAVTGPAASPQIAGTVAIRQGAFFDDLRGLAFVGISADLALDGQTLTVAAFSAATPNNGTITASGTVGLTGNLPANLAIAARRAQILDDPVVTLVADADLTITGPVATAPTIAGNVAILTLDVNIPTALPTTLEPLPGTRHVSPPPQAAARLALAREIAARAETGPPFAANLDLTIVALNRIFVRGRGVDAELGGSLRLTGTTLDPIAIGAFDLIRGRLDILGQRLDFTSGRLAFAGDLTPFVDFVAQTQAADITAIIAVRGPADSPTFELTSIPELPEDEILSRVLFGREAGGLTAAQAVQLASGLASLAGGDAGVFEQFRRALGVDGLDVTFGEGGPALGITQYIADNVRLGVRAGARPEDTGVTVDIDLSRRLRLQGQVGADGRSSVGIAYEIEY